MRKLLSMKLVLIACLAIGAVIAVPVLADPPTAGPPGEGDSSMGQLVRLHMELGRFYLLDGEYEAAQNHFLAVTAIELPERGERPEIPAGVELPEGAETVDTPRGRRGPGGNQQRGHRAEGVQTQAYLMAAVSTYLMGDADAAMDLAQTGADMIPEPPGNRERGPCPLEEFIEDPGTFVERFESGAQGLEDRILEIEAELSDNGDE